jgi:hypothetical protein
MLAVCSRTLAHEPPAVHHRVRLVEGDIRSARLDRRYALVTLPFRAFQHLLTVEDQLSALGNIQRHLLPGGRLALDLFNPSLPFLVDERITIEPHAEPAFTMPDGRVVVRSFRIAGRDYLAQTQVVEFTIAVTHPDGREDRRVESFPLRYVFRFELEHLLVRAGFRVTSMTAGFAGEPLGSVYPGELVVIAVPA